MTDWADEATAAADLHLDLALSNVIHHPVMAVSLSACEQCGSEIPKRRQQAVPGVRLCVECQGALERMR